MERSALTRVKNKRRRQENPCVFCDKPTRDWDYICRQCREDWYQGKEARCAIENDGARRKDERIPVYSYWSYMYFNNEDEPKTRNEIGYRIRQAALNLADGRKDEMAPYFGSKVGGLVGRPNEGRGSYNEGHSVYIFPRRGTWKNLNDLNNAILDLVHYYYRDGYKHGRRLLHQIARGELTIEEINERMAKKQ